jgi:hypothetical protein
MMIQLRSSVYFARFEEGVVFRGGPAPLIFRGKRAYDLVRAVNAQMERGTTREALLGQVPEQLRPVAAKLLTELKDHNLLRERDPGDVRIENGLPAQLRNMWGYLADHHREPGKAMESWSKLLIGLEGTAEAQLYAVRALAECGARNFVLGPPVSGERPGATFDEAAARSALEAEFDGISIAAGTGAPGAASSGAAVRIHAMGGLPFRPESCSYSDAWFFGLVAGHLLFAYVPGPLAEVLPEWQAVMRPAVSGWEGARLAEQRIALAASAVAFGAFKRQLGVAAGTDLSQPHLVGPSELLEPVVMPSPIRITEDAAGAAVPETGESGSGADADTDPAAAAETLFDGVTGILEDDHSDLVQVPLSISRIHVFGADRQSLGASAFGWGASAALARSLAIRRGVRAHLRALHPNAAVAVADTPEDSRAEVLASAAIAVSEAGASWERLETSRLASPDAHKTAKLLALMGGGEAVIEYRRCAGPRAAAVRVTLDGRLIAQEAAANLDYAAYLALGDACAILQVPELEAAAPKPLAAGAGAGQDLSEARVRSVDLGYAGLGRHLHCALVEL